MSPMKKEEYRHLPLRDWGERLKDGAPYFADLLQTFDGRIVLVRHGHSSAVPQHQCAHAACRFLV